jgi:hypothetical protein
VNTQAAEIDPRTERMPFPGVARNEVEISS